MIKYNFKIYKGLLISLEYTRAKDFTLKAYNGYNLVEKKRYLDYLPSQAIKDFYNYLENNYFQFNTII